MSVEDFYDTEPDRPDREADADLAETAREALADVVRAEAWDPTDPAGIPELADVDGMPFCLLHDGACLDDRGRCTWPEPIPDWVPVMEAAIAAALALHLSLPTRDCPTYVEALADWAV